MTPATCILMAEYNRWMNLRLYDGAAKLSDEQLFEDRGAFFGSLFGTLNHIAAGDTIWLHRFVHHPDLVWMKKALDAFPHPPSLTHRLAHSLTDLRTYRERTNELIGNFASRVTLEQLATTLRYANTAGQPQARNFGALVQHFFNHQSHHRLH